MPFRLVIAAVFFLVSTATKELPAYRLPGNVIPYLYSLSISTDLDLFIFNGTVDIMIECKSETNVIKIHSKELEIVTKSVAVKGIADTNVMAISSVTFDVDNDFLIIQVKNRLVPGSIYLLHIKFQGYLNDGLLGYYRSSYIDLATNTTKWLAVTQFEPDHARRAFPCFDEPAMKANFRIGLGHRIGLNSVSNMYLISSTKDEERPGWVWDRYEYSVQMSSYLVVFMVSDFQHRQYYSEANNVLFRVWARKDAINQTEFTLNCNPKILAFYEDFFEINFPLAKLDSAAIPDFAAGAMENWGLVTYRESLFLVDEMTSAVKDKYSIANVIGHELAHMWFGNLVTMRWWTDLWLNEGFATFVARLAVQELFPHWNGYNFEVVSNLLEIFPLDALRSSHPVYVPIEHPNQINQIFDAISYKKGAFLLHMMYGFLGSKVFRSGVTNYLMKFSYKNTETDDLWDSLTSAAAKTSVLPPGQTVKSIMDSWTLQTGYPLITVKRDYRRIAVSQKRFLSVRSKSEKQPEECWWIPLTFYTASYNNYNETRSTQWLSCDVPELILNTGVQFSDWIILNNKASGFYRVNYDQHTWTLLTFTLHSPNYTAIHELNRVQLVLDAMSLAKQGLLEYRVALGLLQYIRKERAHNPWRAALTSLWEIKTLLWRTEKFYEFKRFVQHLLSETYEDFSDLTSKHEKFEEIKQKEMIVKLACAYQVGNCVQKANRLFKHWISTGTNKIPKDLRGTVYCVGVRNGGQKAWDYVWNQYQASNLANEKSLFLSALACTESKILLSRYLQKSIDATSGIRRQDLALVLKSIALTTQLGFRLAWEFLVKNIQEIYDYVKPNMWPLEKFVTALIEMMVYSEEFSEMKKFVKLNSSLLEAIQMKINQAFEVAESNLEWMKSFYNEISKALVVKSPEIQNIF